MLVNQEFALGLLQCRIGQEGNNKQTDVERVGRFKRTSCNYHRRQTPGNEQNPTSRPQSQDQIQINRNESI